MADTKSSNIGKENPKSVPDITTMKDNKTNHPKKGSFSNIFLLVCIMGISMAILLEIINAAKRNHRYKSNCSEKPKYWVYANHLNVEDRNGLLKHVHSVLETVGVEKSTNKTPWDLLWSHDSPFNPLQEILQKLQPHQKVNHIPGTGYIATKVYLATANSTYVPKAFMLPQSKDDFFKYAKKFKNSLFLEKSNNHRGVRLKNVSDVDVSSGTNFVQEYIQKPFLVDGHKFDIGVYVAITSVDPLRAYWYKGDVLFRSGLIRIYVPIYTASVVQCFYWGEIRSVMTDSILPQYLLEICDVVFPRYCPSKYYPFDPNDLDKYVIGADYLPTWEVPSLAQPYTALGHSMKDSFDIYVRSKGKDPSDMWEDVQKAIAEILVMKAPHMVTATKRYPSQDNFFEMMRFDLIVDEDLKVYLLEANMSPNLDSAHFKPNAILYEQVLYNLFSLMGISRKLTSNKESVKSMVSAQKNIAVFGKLCATVCNDNCEALPLCKLCRPCLDQKLRNSLLKAHTEFLHRGDFRRLVPPPMNPEKNATQPPEIVSKDGRSINELQHMWYQEKCNRDITWCS